MSGRVTTTISVPVRLPFGIGLPTSAIEDAVKVAGATARVAHPDLNVRLHCERPWTMAAWRAFKGWDTTLPIVSEMETYEIHGYIDAEAPEDAIHAATTVQEVFHAVIAQHEERSRRRLYGQLTPAIAP